MTNWMRRTIAPLAVSACLLALAACGDISPSATEMRKAIEAAHAAKREELVATIGMRSTVDAILPPLRIESFERIGCNAAGENAFACSYRVAANGRPATIAESRFLKTRGGWEVML